MQNHPTLASIPLDNLDQATGGYLDHDPESRPDDSGVGRLSPARCSPLVSPQQSAPPVWVLV